MQKNFFTNDKVLIGWVSKENSKKNLNIIKKTLWVLQSTFEYGKKHTDNYRNSKKNFLHKCFN